MASGRKCRVGVSVTVVELFGKQMEFNRGGRCGYELKMRGLFSVQRLLRILFVPMNTQIAQKRLSSCTVAVNIRF